MQNRCVCNGLCKSSSRGNYIVVLTSMKLIFRKSSGSNGEVVLQLNMTFPMKSEDTLGILPSQLDAALHSIQLKAFAVNNFTEGIYNASYLHASSFTDANNIL